MFFSALTNFIHARVSAKRNYFIPFRSRFRFSVLYKVSMLFINNCPLSIVYCQLFTIFAMSLRRWCVKNTGKGHPPTGGVVNGIPYMERRLSRALILTHRNLRNFAKAIREHCNGRCHGYVIRRTPFGYSSYSRWTYCITYRRGV